MTDNELLRALEELVELVKKPKTTLNKEELLKQVSEMYATGELETHELMAEMPNEDITDYVSNNFDVPEVFSDDDITDYVKDNFSIGEIYDTDDICEYVKDNCEINDLVTWC